MRHPINSTLVRLLRHRRLLTQQELAKAAGLNVRTVQRVERLSHDKLCSADTGRRVASALGVTVEEICQREHPLLERPRVGRSHVVVVASTKPGTGRTIVAISLAGFLHQQGYRVCLLGFCDRPGAQYYIARAHALGRPAPTHVLVANPTMATRKLTELRREYEYIIVDTSGYEDEDLISLALVAEQVLLTTVHPQMDFIVARVEMWRTIAAAADCKISIVQNRVSRYRAHRRDDLAFLQRVGWPVCKAVLGDRQAYEYAFARGQPVTVDDPEGITSTEILRLAHELGFVDKRPTGATRDRRRTKKDWRDHQAAVEMIISRSGRRAAS